jgi:hypothetical protein
VTALGRRIEMLAEKDAGAEIRRPTGSVEIADLEGRWRLLSVYERQRFLAVEVASPRLLLFRAERRDSLASVTSTSTSEPVK